MFAKLLDIFSNKWVLYGVAALAISTAVAANFVYINRLKNDVVELSVDLQESETRRVISEATQTELQRQLDNNLARMSELESANQAAFAQWAQLSNQLWAIGEQPTTALGSDVTFYTTDLTNETLAALSRLNADANRLLERTSAFAAGSRSN